MCAAPLAPPPDNTRPTFGRTLTLVESWEYAEIESASKHATLIIQISFFIMLYIGIGAAKLQKIF